jgi:hypothetical protein
MSKQPEFVMSRGRRERRFAITFSQKGNYLGPSPLSPIRINLTYVSSTIKTI